jgi:protein MpaA
MAAVAAGCGGSELGGPADRRTASPDAPLSRPSSAVTRTELLGRSVRGRPIRVIERRALRSRRTVLIVGCIHGGECAGLSITRRLLSGPGPDRTRLWVLPVLNPDGRALGTRLNARGVDLNRNFPADWRPIGRRGHPEYAGPRPLSEPESRLAARLIRRERPDLTIWFHQPAALVRAWDRSIRPARRYARLASVPFRALPWLSGTAPNWQNRRFRRSASFVVELPPGSLSAASARRHAAAIRRLAP